MQQTSNLHIRKEDFLRFRDFFYRKTGIFFDESKRYFVDRRLIERMRATGAPDFRTYFTRLRFEASNRELQNLINLMTVNETYFFREEHQLRCLVQELLPELTRRRLDRRPIRIWSIPASTGEEPYSIAIYLLEYWPDLEHWDVELVASDIDTEALDRARQGRYNARSVQYVPYHLRRKYFTRVDTDYQICDMLREVVTFTRVNLCDAQDMRPYRDFSVIFCRNLLIYFDEASRKTAAHHLYEALEPGGYLCLGHSESMSRISSLFQVRRFTEAIVYQKPEMSYETCASCG